MTKITKAPSNINRRGLVASMTDDRLVYLASYLLPRVRGEDIPDGDCIDRELVS
jgi:hypothetical protein